MPDAPDGLWWRARAACRVAPLVLVDEAFRSPGGPAGDEFRNKFCAACPVARACFREAMETGEAGVWAGTTPTFRSIHGAPSYRKPNHDPSRLAREA